MTNPAGGDERRGRLSGDEVVRFTEEIAGVTGSGFPLASGLMATAEEMPRGRVRSSLRRVAKALECGESVEDAVAQQGDRLPGHLRGLVLVGTRTGKMGGVLGRFVGFVNVGSDLRRGLMISLAYPTILLVLAASVFVFVSSMLVGSFATIFRDFGISLPTITGAIIGLSQWLALETRVALELLVTIGVLLLLPYLFLSGPVRRSLLSSIPLVGSVWRNASLAEFCHLLALLLECEIPLGEAVRLTADGVPDASIDAACGELGRDVDAGYSLSEAVARHPSFARGLSRLLAWAETHQSLPESLRMAGEMYEANARNQAGLAGTVLWVLSVMSVFVGLGTMVVALMLPMVMLISKLSG